MKLVSHFELASLGILQPRALRHQAACQLGRQDLSCGDRSRVLGSHRAIDAEIASRRRGPQRVVICRDPYLCRACCSVIGSGVDQQ